ncbi:MarR family transcriptional regulator [Haloprofundus halophilus]|uniref:MarR family transcriptional regulator n=1 Tax=Haloprofundus halophilus TaxID=2283527 RepID=UPI000E434FCE|nr:MarR family transcriptional regulator [Haloprofundus halophilus]
MARIPDEFCEEFDSKGETFFKIAELLYTHPDRRYTQDELAERMNCSNTTISTHTRTMVSEKWLDRQDNQTTFAWNSETHNPASTEGTTAIRRFYADLWNLLKKHSDTVPGTFALFGFAMFLGAIVVFAFFVGYSLNFTQESSFPPVVYLAITAGLLLTGFIVTILSPLQAELNRVVFRILPDNLSQKKR